MIFSPYFSEPDPPSNLDLEPQENIVTLTWTPPSTDYDGIMICWYSVNGTVGPSQMLPSDDTSYEWEIPFPEYEFVVSVATYVGNEDSYILSEKVTDFITLSEYQWNKIVCNNYELIKSSFIAGCDSNDCVYMFECEWSCWV